MKCQQLLFQSYRLKDTQESICLVYQRMATWLSVNWITCKIVLSHQWDSLNSSQGKSSTNHKDPPQIFLGNICLLFVFEAASLCVVKASPKLLAILLLGLQTWEHVCVHEVQRAAR